MRGALSLSVLSSKPSLGIACASTERQMTSLDLMLPVGVLAREFPRAISQLSNQLPWLVDSLSCYMLPPGWPSHVLFITLALPGGAMHVPWAVFTLTMHLLLILLRVKVYLATFRACRMCPSFSRRDQELWSPQFFNERRHFFSLYFESLDHILCLL